MLNLVKESHDILGMIILFLLLIVIIGILISFLRKKPFGKSSKTLSLIGLILVHLQVVVGFALYFLSPLGYGNFSGESMKHTISRFFIVEHPLGMIIAAILVTIGYKRAKNDIRTDAKRHQQILVFYGIGLALISYLISWFLWS